MNIRLKAYIAGFLACHALESLWQDYYGLEGYVQYVRAGWMSAWVTVPFAIAMLIAAFIFYHKAAEAEG